MVVATGCELIGGQPAIQREHKNIYHYVKEASESENENSSEIGEQNGTTCRYIQSKIHKFIKIRITLLQVSLLQSLTTSLVCNACSDT